jgi:hypothetical protein
LTKSGYERQPDIPHHPGCLKSKEFSAVMRKRGILQKRLTREIQEASFLKAPHGQNQFHLLDKVAWLD